MSGAAHETDPASALFYEVILEGHPEHSRGLLRGLVLGAGVKGRLYFSREEGVSRLSLGERLRGIVGLQGICHAIVDETVRQLLEEHTAELTEHGEMRMAGSKPIRAAHFEFRYHAYARRYGREIDELLRSLPEGVHVEAGEPRETIDEKARGVEAYSPAHEYEVEGEGKISGRIDLLIEARHRLDEHPLIRVGEIELEFAQGQPASPPRT